MSNEVFDRLTLFRDLQAQYAAFRAEQHFITAQVMCCATTARLEAIDLEQGRWAGVYRDEIAAFGGLDALTASAGPRVPLSAGSWPVSAAVRGSAACAWPPC